MHILLSVLCSFSLTTPAVARAALAPPDAPATIDQLDELKRGLRERDDRDRQKAVAGLAELGSDEAWELVLGALTDPSPRVADEAQIRLGSAPASLVPALFGKGGLGSRREHVALRVAEALGRLEGPGEVKEWAAALRHGDPDVRRSLLWSVERQALAGRFGPGDEALAEATLKLADRDKVDAVRAHALAALAALAPERARERLAGALRDRSAPVRGAAVERLDLLPEAERLAVARAAAEDEALVVRLRAAGALASRRDREGVIALIEALEREEELRLSWHLVERLQDLSGMKHGRDPRSWLLWAETLPEDWTPAAEPASFVRDYGERTAAFVGMPILSGRIAFLIDFSGSMWMEREGKTRKEVVDVELRRALEALPETTEFNVHPFTDVPFHWQKRLVPASAKNVQKALDWFEKCNEQGKGNFWDAAMAALEDPRVDTLMVLTDGAPSGGHRWNVSLMKELFPHEVRFHGVFLEVLLVDASQFLKTQWAATSAATGGRVLAVEL